MDPVSLISTLAQFYTWLIIAYVLMSWFPVSGAFADVYRVIASLVEPYLNIFRRIIPPIGMIDISPIVALFVLRLLVNLLSQVLFRL